MQARHDHLFRPEPEPDPDPPERWLWRLEVATEGISRQRNGGTI